MNQIEKAAEYVVYRCKEHGIIVHRHRSKTSNSIYLKFDYGVSHSLRISDHKGIEKYHYKFVIIKGLKEIVRVNYRNASHSTFYPFRKILQCVEEILMHREKMIEKFGGEDGYRAEVERVRAKIENLPFEKLYPFWKFGERVC